MSDGPLIVQSDKTLLLDIDHPLSTECRRAIAPFAELEKSPEHIHTYRLTSLGLWNARAAGHDAEQSSIPSLNTHDMQFLMLFFLISQKLWVATDDFALNHIQYTD